MRRRQRRMKANPSAPEGLALQGASAALRGWAVESPTAGAARLASAPLQSQRGSRGILRQAPWEQPDAVQFVNPAIALELDQVRLQREPGPCVAVGRDIVVHHGRQGVESGLGQSGQAAQYLGLAREAMRAQRLENIFTPLHQVTVARS